MKTSRFSEQQIAFVLRQAEGKERRLLRFAGRRRLAKGPITSGARSSVG